MSPASQTVVIVGAVALGPKAACRLKRLEPDARVVMLDAQERISYGGCGIPYFVSGDVNSADELMNTSFHMRRDARFFQTAKGVEVRTRHRVLAIDRTARTVRVRDLDAGQEYDLAWDKLVLATGSTPRRPPIRGLDLDGVHGVSGLDDAEAVRARVQAGQVERAVVIGGGFIGLEMAEALADMWGVETSVVELTDQVLSGLAGPTLARSAVAHMREQGVEFFFGETVAALEPDQAGRVARVVTDRRTLDADLVILAAGVAPNADLARDTGLDIGESGGILVNECLQTSDPNIFAGGDCAEVANLVTGGPGYFPLGSMANRQGRVIGTNLSRKAALDRGAGMARFRGAVGTWCVKLFQRAAAGAGLSAQAALDRGMDVLNVHMVQLDRAHFYPEKDLMSLDLVVERGSGRVLGIQGLSGNGDALLARINPVAALLQHGAPTVEDVSTLEVAYSPPFAAAMDVVNALGNAAENLLAGRMRNVEAGDFERLWQADEVTVLDCRAAVQGGAMAEKHPGRWLSIPQDELRERLPEVPRDKPLVLVCNTGVRSFESQIVLDAAGLGRSLNLAGGMAALGRAGVDVGQE